MLLATLLKTAPSLGTNQGLRRPFTLGLMRHVHLVRLNCLVKMLTAILPNAEPIDLLCRLFSKGLQLPAVGATAIQLYRLGPIRGLPGGNSLRSRRNSAAHFHKVRKAASAASPHCR
jgi:hypothetical protein